MKTLEAMPAPELRSTAGHEAVAFRLTPTKIQATHRDRLAVVYVRQSTPQQVLENRESTARQYACSASSDWPVSRSRSPRAWCRRARSRR